MLLIFSFCNFAFGDCKLGVCDLICLVYKMFPDFRKYDFAWNSKCLNSEKSVDRSGGSASACIPPGSGCRTFRTVIYPAVCPGPHLSLPLSRSRHGTCWITCHTNVIICCISHWLCQIRSPPLNVTGLCTHSFTSFVTSLVGWERYFLHFPVRKTNAHRPRILAFAVRTGVRWLICSQISLRKENSHHVVLRKASLDQSSLWMQFGSQLEPCSTRQLTTEGGRRFSSCPGCVSNFLHCYLRHSVCFPTDYFMG